MVKSERMMTAYHMEYFLLHRVNISLLYSVLIMPFPARQYLKKAVHVNACMLGAVVCLYFEDNHIAKTGGHKRLRSHVRRPILVMYRAKLIHAWLDHSCMDDG